MCCGNMYLASFCEFHKIYLKFMALQPHETSETLYQLPSKVITSQKQNLSFYLNKPTL